MTNNIQHKRKSCFIHSHEMYSWGNVLVFFICFLTILLVDMFVQYSSGDDLMHLKLAKECNLFEFIYKCGTSRISKKISLWIVMRLNINAWRILNAAIFTIFYYSISKIIQIVGAVKNVEQLFFIRCILLVSFVFVHASIIGFSVFWVTGTQDYLWPLTFGIISLLPEIGYKFDNKTINFFQLIGMVFGSLWGGLGQEQISFMLLCISIMLFLYKREQNTLNRKTNLYILLIIFIRVCCVLFLIFAPANQQRLITEGYYGGFDKLSIIEHLFLTVQWELTAFANEMKLLFVALWMILGLYFYSKGEKIKSVFLVVQIICIIPSFIGNFFLNDLGISTMTDMGIDVDAIVKATNNTVSFYSMSFLNWIGLAFWFITIFVITPYFLKNKPTCCVLYCLSIMLPLMLIVSASMYVSGGRIFFTTGILLNCVICILLTEPDLKRYLICLSAAFAVFGIYEIGMDANYLVTNMLQ